MRKLILLSSVAVVASAAAFAQTKAPQSFNYQGALRMPTGIPLANTTVGLRLSIVADTENGAVEYYEVRQVKTNALGLYSVKINSPGALVSSVNEGRPFTNIAWGAGDKYFRVEVDPSGGTNYTFAGSTPILSTPYAIYAEKGGSSGYNTWVSNPDNAGKTPDQYISFLKNQAATQVATNAKDLTANSGGIDGLLTIDNGVGAVLNTAVINLDKDKFYQAARQAVTDGLNGAATDATAVALKSALDGASAKLITDPNSEISKSLGAAATTAGNPLNTGIDQAAGAAAQNPASATTQGLVNGLVGSAGAPGANAPLQDAIQETVANGLNQNPAPAGSPAAALQDVVNQLISSNTSGNGELKSFNDGTDATQILTIADGAKAAFHDATYTISKTALNKNTTDALTATDGANGANALQDALANGSANALNADPTNPAQQAFQDAANNNTADALAANPANPVQQAVKDAANNNTADALAANPATPGSPAAALQDALSNLVNANGEDFKTLNADGIATDTNILQIGADNVISDVAKSVLKEIDLRANKQAINNSVAAGIANIDGTPGTSTALQNALNNNTATTFNADPATATPSQVVAQESIKNNIADGLSSTATPPTAVDQALKDGVANAVTNALDPVPAAAGTPAAAMQDALKSLANSNAQDFKTANVDGVGTESNILQIGADNTATDEAKSVLKEIDLRINKGALNKNTTDALIATDGVNGANALQDALAQASANALNVDPATATPEQKEFQNAINNATADALNPMDATGNPIPVTPAQQAAQDAANQNTANALTATPANEAQQALQDAVKDLAAANSEDFKTANTTGNGTETNILQIGTDNTATDKAKSVLKEIDLRINKGALNKNTADALTATDGTDGANVLQDALNKGIASQLDPNKQVDTNGDGTPDANPAVQALNDLISVNTNGAGSLTNTGAENILTVNGAAASADGANATFKNVQLEVTKSAVQSAVGEGLAAAPSGNAELKNALANANAEALKAEPGTSAQQVFQDAVNQNAADGIQKALTTPNDAGAGDNDLAEAIKDAAGQATEGNGKLSATENSVGTATATTPILTVSDVDNKATFQNVAVNLDKEALKQNIADALNKAAVDPSTGTAGDNALATAIGAAATKTAADGTVTTASTGTSTTEILTVGAAETTQAATTFANLDLRISKDALNNNTNSALTATSPAAGTPAATMQDAVKNLAGQVTSGAAGALANNGGTDNTNILSVSQGAANSTFKNVEYTVSKLALNNNTTDALTNPTAANGGDNLTTAVQNAAKAVAGTNGVSANTGQSVITIANNSGSTLKLVNVVYSQEAANKAVADAVTGTDTNPQAAALKTAVENVAKSAATGNVTGVKDNTKTEVVSVTTNLNTTFGNVVVNYSQEAANKAVADAVTGTDTNPQAAALKTAVENAAKSAVTANNGLTANPSGNIQLGGALVQPTTVTTDATNTLTLAGLENKSTDPNYNQVLIQNTAGVVAYASASLIKPQAFYAESGVAVNSNGTTDAAPAPTDNTNYAFTSANFAGVTLANISVYKNGVRLPSGTYALAGTTLTITHTAPATANNNSTGVEITTGDRIQIQWVK